MIAIAVIIRAILVHIKAYVQEIPEITRKAIQVVKSTTTEISHNKLIQNIKKSYKTAGLAINIVINTTDRTSHTIMHQITNRNAHNIPGMRKLNDEYDKSYQSHSSRPHSDIHD